jgi:transposase
MRPRLASRQLAAWLHARHVRSVALESTGVCWIPVHEVLEVQGFDVVLVDTRTLGWVPGRTKSTADCEWIQRLHSCGLLRRVPAWAAGLYAADPVRDRATLVAERADWRRLQKKPGSDERPHPSGRLGSRRGDGLGDAARYRRRRTGPAAVGHVAGSALSQE